MEPDIYILLDEYIPHIYMRFSDNNSAEYYYVLKNNANLCAMRIRIPDPG
jgi:hypothetical protein